MKPVLRASAAPKASKLESTAGAVHGTGRSGGMVDAPGKKRRKPLPNDPGANIADSQAAKVRTVKTMQKTSRFRGHG